MLSLHTEYFETQKLVFTLMLEHDVIVLSTFAILYVCVHMIYTYIPK